MILSPLTRGRAGCRGQASDRDVVQTFDGGAIHRFEGLWSPVPSESGTSLTSHARMRFAPRRTAPRARFAGTDETHLVRRLVQFASTAK